jgi:hypothetical protein
MKKFKLVVLLLFSSVVLYSCLTDDTESEVEFDISNINTISFNIDNYDFLRNEKGIKKTEDYVYYSKTSKQFLGATNSQENEDLTALLISFAQVEEENLNTIISSFPSTINIVAITLAKDNNNIANGIIIHYVDANDIMQIQIFKKDENLDTYNLVEFSAKKVDHYTLDNVLFIAKTLFPEHDIEALGVNDMDTLISNSKYNDVELLSFASRYGYTPEGLFPPSIDPGGNTRPCGLTHHCQHGNDKATNCQPFAQGCQGQPGICPEESSIEAMETNNMTFEANTVTSSLPSESLYSIRDWLESKQKGKFYVEAYYAISRHFKESINVEVLYKIATASPEIGTFVQAFLNDDTNFVLTEELYNSIVEVAQISANNSGSNLYKDVMAKLINTTEQYKTKSIGEIKNLLN